MFRRLFGSSSGHNPAAPKNQIEVVCPSCGAAQFEPRLVVSTFCKRCGVHLRLEKKKVIASEVSKAGGRPEALAPTRSPVPMGNAAAPQLKNVVAGPAASTGPLKPGMVHAPVVTALTTSLPQLETDAPEPEEMGLGMMFKAAGIEQKEATPTPSLPEESIPAPVQEVEVPEIAAPVDFIEPEVAAHPPAEQRPAVEESGAKVAGHVPMAIAELMQQTAQSQAPGTLQKMREQSSIKQQYFKEAECFECGNKFKVGRSSRSVSCPTCGAYISLEDIELNMPSSQTIKTRGDVLIRKRGHLSASHLYARDLRCFGLIEANIQCSNDAIFRTNGTIIGDVNCKKFIVEKGSEITFMNAIHADEMEIHGIITGNVFSKGSVVIGNGGAVNGDVTARSVSIQPGGELNGSMNIVRTPK